ncbi:MAG: lipopolysaccharide biosynthesis protein [Nocardioidaceae bacterium]
MTDSPTVGARRQRSQQHSDDLRQLARGSTYNLIGSFISALLNLVLPVVVTRGLAKQDAGVFFQVTALFTVLFNLGTVGGDTGVLRYLPRAMMARRWPDLQVLLRTALVPAAAAGMLVGGLVAVFAGPLSQLLTESAQGADTMRTALYVLAPLVPAAVVYTTALAATRGLGSVRPLVTVEKIGRPAGEAALVVAVVQVSGSAALVALAWALPYVAAGIVVARWLWRRMHKLRQRWGEDAPRPDVELARGFWRFSAPRALARFFSVALQRFDVVFVGAVRGPVDAAIYAAATRFLVLGLLFVQSIQQVMAPRISQFLGSGERARATTIYRATTAWLTLVSWPIYLFCALYAEVLLRIFGHGYTAGNAAAAILCLSMLVATACGPVDIVLLMGGRSVYSLINTGAALAVDVGLDIWLVPRMGPTGAALGWMAAIAVNNLVPLVQVRRLMRMHPFGRATVCAMAISVVSFVLVAGGVRVALGPTIGSLFVSGFAASVVFLLLVWWARTVLDLTSLSGVLRRRTS